MDRDLVVIGGGSAGLAAATFASRMRAAVTLVEADRVGGDCTWTGCVPSKALLHAARVVQQARTSYWLSGGEVDGPAVMRHVRTAIRRVAEYESAETLGEQGIEVVHGRAAFVDSHAIEVGRRRIAARRFVIATGAVPLEPQISGLRETPHLSYRTVFELDRPPERLLVLGGGPIGAELAQAFARLGSQVTVFELAGRLLPVADPEASSLLAARFAAEGIELRLGAAVESVDRHGDGVEVVAGGERVEGTDVLVALSRRPDTQGLGLDRVGLRTRPAGIVVDDYLRTSVPHIYAAGDVTGGPQFTHYAAWQGYAAARNALFPGRIRGRRRLVPWAVFTDPEVAQLGGEEETRAQAHAHVHRLPLARVDRAQAEADSEGFIKVMTAGDDDTVLGATVVGTGGADVINQLAAAVEAGAGLSRLAQTVLVYPTRGYGLLQLASETRMRRAARSRRVAWARRLAR